MLNHCTNHVQLVNPALFPPAQTPKLPASAPQGAGPGFGQDQVSVQRPAANKGPIVVAPEPARASWTDALFKYVPMIPLFGPFLAAAAKALPTVIEDAKTIGAGLVRAYQDLVVGPRTAPQPLPKPAPRPAAKPVEAGSVRSELTSGNLEVLKRDAIAAIFKRVHGWEINEGAYPFYMGMLKEGKSLADVEAKMLDFKATRAQYGLDY
ncbi:MAG: hypothetical protein ACLGIN_09630 [Candidatus Sericytochromatia bacterium]